MTPFTQHYDWGKPRVASAVAALTGDDRLCSSAACPAKPYAELWMGDHPSGPATARTVAGLSKGCLAQALSEAPNLLGPKLSERKQLPFLMKVLSIQKALSIQAHPDRVLAAKLHTERPDVYKDANHKPEIAIALTDFEALCGFRPVRELAAIAAAVPELRAVLGAAAVGGLARARDAGRAEDEAAALKTAYCALMRAPDEVVRRELRSLVARAAGAAVAATPHEGGGPAGKAVQLALRLHAQFGEDVGVWSAFFLNYVQMGPGECLYMPANTPHAYLSGDIVECMACSDNVVRGGLTPKFKDLDVLCEMLSYKGSGPPAIEPLELDQGARLYGHRDLDEFQVLHARIGGGSRRTQSFSDQGPSLGFVWQGSGSVNIGGETIRLAPGVVFLLAAGAEADIAADDDLQCFVASCPPHYFEPVASQCVAP